MMYTQYIERRYHLKIPMKPVSKNKTTREMIYEELKKAILTKEISDKEVLTETLLAETLNTSRTPIREAVAELVKEGLLVHIPRKGFQVRKISRNESNQIIFLRQTIEAEGIKNLASTIQSHQIQEIESVVEQQKNAMENNDRISFIELDLLFHTRLLQFAHLNVFEQVLHEMYNLTLLVGHHALMKEGRMKEVIIEHGNIILALKESGNAEMKLLDHLNITKHHVMNMSEE